MLWINSSVKVFPTLMLISAPSETRQGCCLIICCRLWMLQNVVVACSVRIMIRKRRKSRILLNKSIQLFEFTIFIQDTADDWITDTLNWEAGLEAAGFVFRSRFLLLYFQLKIQWWFYKFLSSSEFRVLQDRFLGPTRTWKLVAAGFVLFGIVAVFLQEMSVAYKI